MLAYGLHVLHVQCARRFDSLPPASQQSMRGRIAILRPKRTVALTPVGPCAQVTHASSGVLDEVLRIRWEAEQELRQRHGDDD